ncbi:MAG: DNA polymerase I [Planctomycetaceae bacterium]|nr:DNA polymerase I [Planctomycetales bacterium]MCB9873158.1 DNA polymerase I [Planctomycetaceae bacterium]MCB9937838.1 DNA polymerase I [Planctomycetaceae bacterium]
MSDDTDDDVQPDAVREAPPAISTSPKQVADKLPDSLEGQTVYVIDSHSLIYQVFHAMPPLSSPSGQPVGAVHGFIRDVVDIIENKRPNYLFCAFDYPKEVTFRHDLYDKYKANRESMPEDLRPQIPSIHRMLAAMGVPVLQLQGYEADDILATIARITDERGGTCYVVTSDKDCRQLITDRVKMYNIRKQQEFDAAALMEDWGVRPDQVVDYQALVGDSVDNVPGVPLIGPKAARELLETHGTLDQVLATADPNSKKKRELNLVNFRDQALLSRDLVRLVNDVPIEIDWKAGRVGGVDTEVAKELCREFGFRQLADQVANLTAAAAPTEWKSDYRTVATPEALAELVEKMSRQSRISIDTETTSTNPRWAEIVGYSFSWKAGEGFYVPVRAPQGEPQLDPQLAHEALRVILEDPAIEKIGQNLKYDIVVLRNIGVTLRGVAFDTMVADYLLVPGERSHSMDDMALRYLNHKTISIKELIGTGKKQIRMDEVPVAQVTEYAAEDADVPVRLTAILERKLKAEGLDDLYRSVELPLVEILAELEFNGIKVDVERLRELSDRFGERLAKLEIEIYEIAGEEFNIESPKQLSKLLFEKFSLPVIKKTKTGASTDVEVLTELAKQHPLPAKIIDYRQNAKLKSTYVDALPELVHPITKRIHTSFKQDVAATGRLSSTEPNLQNIPIRTEEGREIRSAFLPGEPDWLLMTADYSQIELRVLAHFSGDEAMCQAFAEDRDIHTQVASEVYGVPLEEVTREMRRSAKAVNFGVIYGQSAFGLAKSLDIDKDEAATFIDAYFARYTGVDAFMKKVLEDCRANRYVSTILGRRRAVDGVRDPSRVGDSRQRTLPERIAINTVIQGSAADLIKQAMINVYGRLQREKSSARMLLQIHDELVFEVPTEELTGLAALVTEEMTAAGRLNVPLKVDVKAGKTWAECEAWD